MATATGLIPAAAGGGAGWQVASDKLPMHPADPCGDAAVCLVWPPTGGAQQCLLAIVDGLGHGAEAALAADAALQTLTDAWAAAGSSRPSLAQLLVQVDARLLGLRGAAVGLVRVVPGGLEHAGVGNTRAMRLRDGQLVRLSSQNGIVGGGMPPSLQLSRLDLQPGDWLLLFSDGLNEMLRLPVLLPEWQRDPATLCAHLLRQWRVGHDDASVLVLRVAGG